MLLRHVTRSAIWAGLSAALLIGISCAFSSRAGWLNPLEFWIQDYFTRVKGPHSDPGSVVVITIDNETAEAWGDHPTTFWGDHLGEIIDICRRKGAKAIGLDFVIASDADGFLDSVGAAPEFRPNSKFTLSAVDAASILSLGAASGPGGTTNSPDRSILMSDPKLTMNLSVVSIADESDGVVRKALIHKGKAISMPLKLMQIRGDSPRDPPTEIRIDYNAPMPEVISVMTLMEGLGTDTQTIDRIDLHGSTVIIGASFDGSGDIHQTPIGPMNGSEILGLILNNLDSQLLLPSSRFWSFVMQVGTAILAAVSLIRLRWWCGILVLALLFSAGAFGFFAFYAHTIFPTGSILLSIIFTSLTCAVIFAIQERTHRAHIHDLFGRNVSKEVLNYVLTHGIDSLGDEIECTVMFLDVRDSTAFGAKHTPKQFFRALNKVLEVGAGEVAKENGVVNRYLGDGFLAVFGVPCPVDNAESRALTAAQSAIAAWDQIKDTDLDIRGLDIGISIHCGPVYMGNLGSGSRFEFTIVGDTVNAAAALEAGNRQHGSRIIMSAVCAEKLGGTAGPWPAVTVLTKRGEEIAARIVG